MRCILFLFFAFFCLFHSMSAQQMLSTYLSSKLSYPQTASEKNIMGLVLVNALIDENGKLRKTEVHTGKGGGCTEAVTDALGEIQHWDELIDLSQKNRAIQLPILFIHEAQYENRVSHLSLILDTIQLKVSESLGKDFSFVEKEPVFQGGENQLMRFLGRSIKYPPKAIDRSTCGKVMLGFVVDSTGQVDDVHIIRGIGDGCDEEAMRVVASMPVWQPGSQNGKRVKVSYQLPVLFKFEHNEPRKIFRQAERIDTVKVYNTNYIQPLFEKGESHLKDTLYKMIQEDINGGGNTKAERWKSLLQLMKRARSWMSR
ncbi:hypothetical protein EMGBS15_11420 [Filimonas sp.]|nr:hypothetical protein EMGBS15_11420 [Filimonas sp.]